jgi:L-threonylcarbamoyladenylate synthase
MSVLQPTRENLALATHQLQNGNLVVLPTETVYGLAADATNPEAVAKIFKLKGRPSDNPLIVHIASLKQIHQFAIAIPDSVQILAEAFMPGPLTVVLSKQPHVSEIVTGGLDTVAIRMPEHPACLAVMELGDLSLAMPSANPFMGLSPTNVKMIDPAIGDGVAAIIDGGPCILGIESTVLDLTSNEPTILRPGSIGKDLIEQVLNLKVGDSATMRKAPGMYRRHYAPRTKCIVTGSVESDQPGLVFGEPANGNQIQMPSDSIAYAHQLYANLSDLDNRGLSEFFVQAPPMNVHWLAVWDRLSKATS